MNELDANQYIEAVMDTLSATGIKISDRVTDRSNPFSLSHSKESVRTPPHITGKNETEVFPFHQALIDYEKFKLQLAMAPSPAEAEKLENTELAHSPLSLSPLAWPKAYEYPVQHRSEDPVSRGRIPTYLLVFREETGGISYLELVPAAYTLVSALKLASDDHCPLSGIELLLGLAEYWNMDNVVQFVEQGLKLLSHLNEQGLIQGISKAEHEVCRQNN